MARVETTSLFDATGTEPVASAVNWLTGTLLGTVATGLCIIAVAIVGFMMLSGRMHVRTGARVVTGCFILIGAPVIAAGLFGLADEAAGDNPPTAVVVEVPPPRPPLPPSQYDPYAGASLPSNR